MTTPVPPVAAEALPEITQLGAALVDTPNGQRLALTMTMLLPAGDARQFADAFAAAAAQMSKSGLVIASGLNGGHVG